MEPPKCLWDIKVRSVGGPELLSAPGYTDGIKRAWGKRENRKREKEWQEGP